MENTQTEAVVKGVDEEAVQESKGMSLFKFSALEFTFQFAMGVANYLTSFLQSIGFTATQVGTINSLNSGVGIVATTLFGMLSDKIRSLKKVIILCLIGLAVFYTLIPITSDLKIFGFSVMLGVIPAAFFFRVPSMSLVENWVVRAAHKRGLNYGFVRSFGSLSFAIMGLILGIVLPKIGLEWSFYLCPVMLLPVILLCLSIKEQEHGDAVKKKTLSLREMKFSRLFKNYYYMTHLVFSIALNMPMNCAMTFLPYLVASVGGDVGQIGFVTGYRALIEIPMLLLLKPLRRKVPLYYLPIGAAILYGVEAMLYSSAGSLAQVVLLSTLHGLGAGLFIGSSNNYIFSLAPDELKATAQTFNGSMNSVAGIIASLLGGRLIDLIGIADFYRVCGVLVLGAVVLYVLTFIFGEKVLKLKRPGLSV